MSEHDTVKPLSRYEIREDDERFGLCAGDIVVCERMHPAWAEEKVRVLYRESDGYQPECSQYRRNVRHVSGPRV